MESVMDVRYEYEVKNQRTLRCGVPQGSLIGPLIHFDINFSNSVGMYLDDV